MLKRMVKMVMQRRELLQIQEVNRYRYQHLIEIALLFQLKVWIDSYLQECQ